jgi:pimeloyl-ACP methyl ester carboxylesterase
MAALLAVPSSMLVRGLLEWVANHSGVDEAVIRGFQRDVSAYLDLPGCRAAVQDVVRPPLLAADAHSVLVGHSLGGVVCAELLAEDQVRERVGLFVAVGAPLGLEAVTEGMRPPGSGRPASPWVNVYDPRDWVALGSPLPQTDGLREQLGVANPRSYEHSIESYLAHPEVATVIADPLDG